MGSFFLRPETLFWLAPLAALPILIHLFSRRRYKRVDWAAMEFLRRAFERTRRRVRLENLILLLLRVAALVLLVLALARPFVGEQSPLAALAQSKRNLVILLDRSYSMGYVDLLGNSFDRAKERARRLLDELEPDRGDSVTIVLASEAAEVPIEAAVDIERAKEEFERIEIGHGRTELLAAVQEVARLAKKLQTNQEVWFFTDLRAKDWLPGDAETSGSRPELAAALADIPVPVTVVDCGTESAANLGIVRLVPEERLVRAGSPVQFQAEVRNWGREMANFELQVWIGDVRVKGPALQDVPPGQTRTVPFDLAFERPGPVAVRVQIGDGDSLREDDSRWIAINVRDAVRVLVVDGKSGAQNRLERPSGLFVYALDPAIGEEPDRFGEALPSLFDIVEITEFQFAAQDLERFDLVAFVDVDLDGSNIPPDRLAALRDRVAAGGAFLAFAGDDVVPDTYTGFLYSPEGPSLLPAPLLPGKGTAAVREGGTRLRVPPSSFDHPLVKRLMQQRDFRNAIERPAVHRMIPSVLGSGGKGARALLVFQDDQETPALVEGAVGNKGKSIFFATSADDAWNELPEYPEYLVLMNEVVYYLMAESPARRNPRLFEPITRTFHRFIADVSMTRPDGERAPVQVRIPEGGKGAIVAYPDTDEPGAYELRSAESFSDEERPGIEGYDVFCVNVDPDEGNVERTTRDRVRIAYPDFKFDFEVDSPKAEAGPTRNEGELWRHLAFAVLVLVFLESFLAQKFGDYARKSD